MRDCLNDGECVLRNSKGHIMYKDKQHLVSVEEDIKHGIDDWKAICDCKNGIFEGERCEIGKQSYVWHEELQTVSWKVLR